MCWNVSIVPIQIRLASGGSSENNQEEPSVDAIAEALNYCRLNGISIINCSFGQYQNSAYYTQVKDWIDDWGGILVASAGNDIINTDEVNHYPSNVNSEHVISVGAYNSVGTGLWVSSTSSDVGSNFGKETVDILAPGNNIYVLTENNGYAIRNGTSFAAPFVTGAAALLKSAYPEATSEEIIAALKLGCQHFSWTENVVKHGCLKIDRSLIILESIIENGIPIENGNYIFGSDNNSFQVLDITNNSVENAISTQIFEANGSNSQKFEIVYHCENVNSLYYTIKNINSGKYLECANGSTAVGTIVQQNDWTGDDSQKWIIKHVSDGTYIIKNKKSGLAIDFGVSNPSNGQSVTLQAAENTADQKFRIIPSGENVEIPDGLYTIACKNNSQIRISNVDGNIQLGSATTFKVTNYDGYCHISEFYGNKAIDLTNGGTAHLTNIQAVTEDYSSNNQKWIIRNTGTGSVYITSYLTNKVLGGVDDSTTSGTNIALLTPNGKDSQQFNFIEESRDGETSNKYKIGQFCYAVNENETQGIDISNNTLYNVNGDIIQLSFEKQIYGYYLIRDIESGDLLGIQNDGSVVFSEPTDSERQLWLVYVDSNSLYLFNIYAETYLKYIENSDGSIQVTTSVDETDPNYKDIIFKNFPNIQEDIEYLIIPKNDPEKALMIDDSVQEIPYPIILDNTDFTDMNQRFIFKFSCEDNAYYITSSVSDDLTFYVNTQNANMNSSRKSLFYITQTCDGYYKLGYQNKMFSYVDNSFKSTSDKTENDDDQKFMIIPVSDIITDATYQILIGDDETKALSVNDSMNGNSEIIIETANSSDISQRFYIYNDNGSYKLISMYSGKAISLSEELTDIVQCQIDENNMFQNWQIINSTADGSDYSAKLVSYRIGDYLSFGDDSVSLSYYSGKSDQIFTLKRIPVNTLSSKGEIVSVSDSTKDISVTESSAVLSNISTNGRKTLYFTPDVNGLWTIDEITTGTVLTETNNSLTFEENTSLNSQKWIMHSLSDGSFMIINLHSGKVLKNNNGTLSIGNYTGSQNETFNIYIKGDVNNDGRLASRDLLMIREFIANELQFTDIQRYCADYNDDNFINSRDIRYITQIIEGTSGTSTEQATETSLSATSAFSLTSINASSQYELSNEEIAEMTEAEFLNWLFGDADIENLSVTVLE